MIAVRGLNAFRPSINNVNDNDSNNSKDDNDIHGADDKIMLIEIIVILLSVIITTTKTTTIRIVIMMMMAMTDPDRLDTSFSHRPISSRSLRVGTIKTPAQMHSTHDTARETHIPQHKHEHETAPWCRRTSQLLTRDVLYHTMPHTPCRSEVRYVHSLQCFV